MHHHRLLPCSLLLLLGACAIDSDAPARSADPPGSTNNSTNNNTNNNTNNSAHNANTNNTADRCEGADCSGLDDACALGACDAATGECVVRPVADGTGCDDGDACTVGEVCAGGACGGGAPVDCTELNDACNTGVCDPNTGACVAQPANEGAACDDGERCSEADTCAGGACRGAPKACPLPDDPCVLSACDPGSGQCVEAPAEPGASCEDGDPCTTGEVCSEEGCVGGPRDCSPLTDRCHLGVCEPDEGQCVAMRQEIEPVCRRCPVEVCRGGVCVVLESSCAPGGVVAGPHVALDDVGGPLGAPVSAICGAGQVLVGVTASRTDHHFYSDTPLTCAQFVCGEVVIDPAEGGSLRVEVGDPVPAEPTQCLSPMPAQTLGCPADEAVVGVVAHEFHAMGDGSMRASGVFVAALQLRCAPLRLALDNSGALIVEGGSSALVDGRIGDPMLAGVGAAEPLQCDEGQVAVGLELRAGEVVDGFRLQCAPLGARLTPLQ